MMTERMKAVLELPLFRQAWDWVLLYSWANNFHSLHLQMHLHLFLMKIIMWP